MSTAPTLHNPAKTSKFPTHLAMSGDALLGSAQSASCVHDIETTIYDHDENPHSGTLNVWARDQPAEGLYILNNVPCCTGPFRLAVTESNTMRLVPEEVDGIVASVDTDRKGGELKGWTYMGKRSGWVPWLFRAFFENGVKWNPWYMPNLHAIVSFDVLLHQVREDGIMEVLIRRISVIEGTGATLLQSVGAAPAKASARGAMLKELKAAKKARTVPTTTTEEEDPSPADDFKLVRRRMKHFSISSTTETSSTISTYAHQHKQAKPQIVVSSGTSQSSFTISSYARAPAKTKLRCRSERASILSTIQSSSTISSSARTSPNQAQTQIRTPQHPQHHPVLLHHLFLFAHQPISSPATDPNAPSSAVP
ncbi:hypothetical protein OC834_005543 [Tilletia horrida]|nr:hypothetical protein OC834_005543 [Tilletia horrida]